MAAAGAQAWPTGYRIALTALLISGVVPRAGAFTLETLIMPGRVAEAHAELEDDCGNCHVETEEESQNGLCVACHSGVGADVAAESGFHGRHPDAAAQECASCHTDHEGRDADIVGLDEAAFDHTWTDFVVRGAHERLLCADCHDAGAAWNAAIDTCVGCHAHEDIHRGQLGETCGECHGESNWQDARFDHGSTSFPLTGRHSGVSCDGCHQEQVFHGTPTQCTGCHADDDVHLGRNGAECESCHSTVDWARTAFDHVAATGFPLLGAHEPLACESCHTRDLMTALPRSCHGCHQSEDVHRGGLGTDCASCHSVSSWAGTRFDHDEVIRFPLRGAHQTLECSTCHVDGTDAGLPLECAGCHADDPHRDQLGSRCETCHAEAAWTADVRFDHGLTHFPLIGAHAAIGCETCHATPAFHDAAEDCRSCHAADDAHNGGLGAQCETCHNPSDWQFWSFDHDTQTSFALTGAHVGASCTACHRESDATAVTAPSVCEQCHRRDDPHLGRFGADCGGCHTTESFSDIRGF